MKTMIFFLLMLCGIILVHEFGHFIVAKLCGVYVYEFSLGMGPKLLKWQGKETLYSIRALPLGGFCAMAGEEQEEDNDKIPPERLLSNISKWKQILVLAAGPLMNFLLAWLIFIGVYVSIGHVVVPPPAIINGIIDDSPAQAAGFEYGDVITKVTFSDGTELVPDDFYDIVEYTALYHDEAVYTIERGDEVLEIAVTPVYIEDEQRYMVGMLMPEATVHELTVLECISEGTSYFKENMGMMVMVIQKLIKGIGLDSVSGPVGIYSATEQQLGYGMVYYFLLIGMLSLNIGLMNLIPIPMLDGGRIVIVLFETLFRRKLSQKLQTALMLGSFILLVAIFILSTINDIGRLI